MAYRGKGGAVNNLVLLNDITEEAIVDCLRNHHSNREIYTYIGPVLISVNPYATIQGLYGQSKIKKFILKKEYENDPHVYAVAERAYRSMVNDLSNECVVITGESGSGKTEASKKVMEYIAAMNPSNTKNKEVERVKNQLLESNPLLESFGNAKTVRNDNSSRFGKYMQILFLAGNPSGGLITTYLLEKSRTVNQCPGERNFHIFYELLSNSNYRNRFGLNTSSGFISDPSSNQVSTIDDRENFEDTMKAMRYIGIQDVEQQEIFSIIAFLLHLGNITFSGTKAKIQDKNALQSAAQCLQVSDRDLESALTHRTVKSATEQIKTPLNVQDATNAKESMAKSVYTKLFDYIVNKANEAITCHKYSTSIGVLDIYGFEILGVNGFEQLCINYTNEKLHQLFIELTLKAEQEEYKREGIQWEKVNYQNNKPICDLIEKSRGGVFDMINEESLVPQGKDDSLFNKMKSRLKNKEFAIPSKGRKNEFEIIHYAGNVRYSCDGFIETNKDKLFPDIVQCVSKSGSQVASGLFSGHQATRDSTKVFKRAKTTATQYKENVQELMKALSECNQHYIRCIKPNENKAGGQFDNQLVTTQTRYLGVLEGVIVRRAGYAFRMSYDRFAAKYKCILPENQLQGFNPSSQQVSEQILKGFVKSGYEFGKSKIFIKEANSILGIEDRRKEFLEQARAFLPPEEEGLMFADKVIAMDSKFQKHNLTFCVGAQGFYWFDNVGNNTHFTPLEKIEFVGYNAQAGWMTVHTSYPSKVEGEKVELCYLSENIYADNVKNFIEVMESVGYKIQANEAGAIPHSATDAEEYKQLTKQIAAGERPTVAKGRVLEQAPQCCRII